MNPESPGAIKNRGKHKREPKLAGQYPSKEENIQLGSVGTPLAKRSIGWYIAKAIQILVLNSGRETWKVEHACSVHAPSWWDMHIATGVANA